MGRMLVIGTKNKKKLRELQVLLQGLPWQVVDLSGWSTLPDVEETGETFAANAALKAIGFAKATGEWVLAEDSGLVVPFLKGAPGIYSARYAGMHGDDAANNAKLLTELKGVPPEKRGAYFICSAAIASPDGVIHATSEGRCQGRIIEELKGPGGFGYDPLFRIDEYHATFGELSNVVKEALSHRSRAISLLRPFLVSHQPG
jgi:XTP/dITP diphosphohydrolase